MAFCFFVMCSDSTQDLQYGTSGSLIVNSSKTFIASNDSTGTLTYSGKTYTIKKMKDNKWWMTQNLNVGTMIAASTNPTNNGVIQKYCWNDLEIKCDTFGAYYQWNEAMNYSTVAAAQGICPTGWHIPTKTEMTTLFNTSPIVYQSTYNATGYIYWSPGNLRNSSFFGLTGFQALPIGIRQPTSPYWTGFGDTARFWTSTNIGSSDAFMPYLQWNDAGTPVFWSNLRTYGTPIRCVKN